MVLRPKPHFDDCLDLSDVANVEQALDEVDRYEPRSSTS